MNCIAIRSAGRESSQDYTVQDFDQRLGKPVLEYAVPLLDEASPSIAVIRHRGAWHVLAMSLSSSRFDRTDIRNNKNTVLWRCEDQKSARALAAALLCNWDDVCKIVDGFITASTDAQGWRADDRKLGEAGTGIAVKEDAVKNAPMLDSRLERPYSTAPEKKGPGSGEWKHLADELLNYTLSEEDKIHICVSGWPSEDALRKLRPECTRLLHKGAAADRKLDVPVKPDEQPDGLLSKIVRRVMENPGTTIVLFLIVVVASFFWPDSHAKKKEIERLGFSEVEKNSARLVITFDNVRSDELNRIPDVQAPQGWSVEPKGWDLANRSWSAQLTPPESKRDVRFTIAFPFEVGNQLPKIQSPPAWTVLREWQGQKMVVNVHMAVAAR
jgi:hypothetical protein